jgi:hypothetical protein
MFFLFSILFFVLLSVSPFFIFNQPVINWFLLIMANIVIITGAIIFKMDFKENNLFSPRSIFVGLTILHFGLPSILLSYENSFVNKSNYDFINTAILMIFLSLISYYLGFKYIFGNTKHFKLSNITSYFNEARIKTTILMLYIVGYSARIFIIISGGYFQISRATQVEDLKGPFYSIFYAVEEFPLQALCLSSIVLWAKKDKSTKRFWVFLTIAIASTELLYWLISGRKEQTLMSFIYPLIVYNIMTLKLPSKKVIISFLIFVMLYFPFNYYYRFLIQAGQLGSVNPIELITNPEFLSQLTKFEDTNTNASGNFLDRINLMESVAGAVSIKEQEKWNKIPGQDYIEVLYAFIPRFLWKNKPEFHFGNEFGYLSGVIYPNDTITAISVTFIGEAYLNFKFAGALVLGFFGLFFAYFYKKIFSSKRYLVWLYVYLTILPTLLYFGGSFTLYFGGLIKIVPLSYLIGTFCIKKPS